MCTPLPEQPLKCPPLFSTPFQQAFNLLYLKLKGTLAQSLSPSYAVPSEQLHTGNWKAPLPSSRPPPHSCPAPASKRELRVFGAAVGRAPAPLLVAGPVPTCACTHSPWMCFLLVHMCKAPPSFRNAPFLSFAWKTPVHPLQLPSDVTTLRSLP